MQSITQLVIFTQFATGILGNTRGRILDYLFGEVNDKPQGSVNINLGSPLSFQSYGQNANSIDMGHNGQPVQHYDDMLVSNFLSNGNYGHGHIPQSLIEVLKQIARNRNIPEKAKQAL